MRAMSMVLQRLDEACATVRSRGARAPRIGVVLGSGLGAFAETLGGALAIPYADIPHMPSPAVTGHAGDLVLGRAGGVQIACLGGRVHLYEGHAMEALVFGVRLLARLGCTTVLLTNAAGGLRHEMRPGTLMLVSDHINLTGRSPLLGPNDDALGPRFPDMSRAYDPALGELARRAAIRVGVQLHEGVYAAVHGPAYETPAEIRMLRTLGADAVGMSTVPEVLALRHMGVRCAAISCITNMAAGMTAQPLDHAEVKETAARVRSSFVTLLEAWLEGIGLTEEPDA